jgi:hypothetical protein
VLFRDLLVRGARAVVTGIVALWLRRSRVHGCKTTVSRLIMLRSIEDVRKMAMDEMNY